eukprot:364506-Chlamydomonas_euryale.AAC.5
MHAHTLAHAPPLACAVTDNHLRAVRMYVRVHVHVCVTRVCVRCPPVEVLLDCAVAQPEACRHERLPVPIMRVPPEENVVEGERLRPFQQYAVRPCGVPRRLDAVAPATAVAAAIAVVASAVAACSAVAAADAAAAAAVCERVAAPHTRANGHAAAAAADVFGRRREQRRRSRQAVGSVATAATAAAAVTGSADGGGAAA